MHRPSINLGIHGMGGLVGNSDGYGRDRDEEQQTRDDEIAIGTNACINSLPQMQRWAIVQFCSMGTTSIYSRAIMEQAYSEARGMLETLLRKNPATRLEF